VDAKAVRAKREDQRICLFQKVTFVAVVLGHAPDPTLDNHIQISKHLLPKKSLGQGLVKVLRLKELERNKGSGNREKGRMQRRSPPQDPCSVAGLFREAQLG
jgi:hypothetical protein